MTTPTNGYEKKAIDELNSQIEDWAAKYVKANTVTTSDPVDEKGNLVDQNETPLPIPKSFVIALNDQQAHDERLSAMSHFREGTLGIRSKYGLFIDERILKNPKSVFEGPHCPYHFCWLEDYDKSRDMPRLDQASGDLLMMMMQDGYIPANFHKIGHLHVTGEEAALLAIPRTRSHVQAIAAKNAGAKRRGEKPSPMPPQLPPSLWDKFGTILPPVIAQDGSFWIGRHRLYMIEAPLVRQREMENRVMANRNLHKTGSGIEQEPGAGGSTFDIDLDAMFGGRTFGR